MHLNLPKGRHPKVSPSKSHALVPHQSQRKPQFSAIFGRTNQANYNILNQPYNPLNPFPAQTLQNTEWNHQARESFDDDAFQRAFDAAEQSVTDSTKYVQQEFPVRAQNVLMQSNPRISAQGLETPSSRQNQGRSNGPLESTSESQHGVHDADGLARTAGELLDKVKHESNPKFQNSNFLSLMRQLRDREVHVEGDKIVNVSSQRISSVLRWLIQFKTAHPLHPGGKFYPHTSTQNNQEDIEGLSYSDTTMTGAIHNDRAEA